MQVAASAECMLKRSDAWAARIIADRLHDLEHGTLSPSSDPQQRSSIRSRLLSDAAALGGAINDLKRIANAYAPINSLPDELLLAIINCVAKAEPSVFKINGMEHTAGKPEEKTLGYLKVAHICHRWRQSLLPQSPTSEADVVLSAAAPCFGVHLRIFSFPSIHLIAGLSTLDLFRLDNLNVDQTMALLSQASSLETISFMNCGWQTRRIDEENTTDVTL